MTGTTETLPVLAERDRLARLLESDGAEMEGRGYSFADDVADFSYVSDGHVYAVQILDHGQIDPADRIDDAEALAWYRATFDDDGTSDDLALARMYAWARGQSVGPFAQGVQLRSENYAPAPF